MKALRTVVACVALLLVTTPSFAQGGEEVVYFHADAIGSVRLVTDASGAIVERYDYLPFGEPYPSASAVETRRFAGKERDAETGLDYFGGRYYASANGRFTAVDPMLDVKEAIIDPQRWNRYFYVRANPFRFIDPDGRDTVPTNWQMTYGADGLAIGLPAIAKGLFNVLMGWNTPGHNLTAEGEARRQAQLMQPANTEEAVIMGLTEWGMVAAPLLRALGRASSIELGTGGLSAAQEIGILRDAARGRGNFGLGSATAEDAARLGEAWVGKGHGVASDGKTLVSADGLRQYRPPTYKPSQRRKQANFEQRPVPWGGWGSNGHLDIVDVYK